MKSQPSSRCSSFAHRVHRDARREDGHHGERNRVQGAGLLVEPQLQVFGDRARAGAVVERHHEQPDEDHGRDRANPVEVRRRDAVFGPAGAHADDFLRAEVRRDERQAGDPGGNRAARQEEVRARLRIALEHHADAQHEREIDQDDRVVDPVELHSPSAAVNTTLSRHIHLLDSARGRR